VTKKKRITEFKSFAPSVPPPTERLYVQPLIIMFQVPGEKGVTCHIYPTKPGEDGWSDYMHYGILICDLVRYVAGAFNVTEDDVWEWVDKERRRGPTAKITWAS
jgi:hypothetical protein